MSLLLLSAFAFAGCHDRVEARNQRARSNDAPASQDPQAWPKRWRSCERDSDCTYVSTGTCLPCDDWGAAVTGVNEKHRSRMLRPGGPLPLPEACRQTRDPCRVSSRCDDGRCEAEILHQTAVE